MRIAPCARHNVSCIERALWVGTKFRNRRHERPATHLNRALSRIMKWQSDSTLWNTGPGFPEFRLGR